MCRLILYPVSGILFNMLLYVSPRNTLSVDHHTLSVPESCIIRIGVSKLQNCAGDSSLFEEGCHGETVDPLDGITVTVPGRRTTRTSNTGRRNWRRARPCP